MQFIHVSDRFRLEFKFGDNMLLLITIEIGITIKEQLVCFIVSTQSTFIGLLYCLSQHSSPNKVSHKQII